MQDGFPVDKGNKVRHRNTDQHTERYTNILLRIFTFNKPPSASKWGKITPFLFWRLTAAACSTLAWPDYLVRSS